MLNSYIVTGISDKKIKRDIYVCNEYTRIKSFQELVEYLKYNNTGRDVDIASCQSYIYSFADPELQEFVTSLITKSLKLGCDTKIVNKVYGKNFVPTHEVQQGSSRDKLRLKVGEEFYLTQKLNGVRGTYVKGELLSRQGISFTGLDHIIEELKSVEMSYGFDVVFDGELIRKNTDGLSDNENFTMGTGIINSDESDKICIEFVLFDILPLHEFQTGQSALKYSERRNTLDKLFENSCFKHLRLVPLMYHGYDQSKIDEFLGYADRQGYEGLMLNKDVPYYCKRHAGLVKIKTFKYNDLKIIGYEEGAGKYVGMLGAVIVEYKGNTVHVGSGFADEQRVEFWKYKDELIGKIVEIKFKEESQDKKTGLKSLQFPTYVRIRSDKSEESYS